MTAWLPDEVAIGLPPVAPGGGRWLTPFLELADRPDGGRQAWPLLGPRATDPPGWQRLVLAPEQGAPLLAPAVLFVAPDSLAAGAVRAALAAQGLAALGPAAWLLSPDWPAVGRPVDRLARAAAGGGRGTGRGGVPRKRSGGVALGRPSAVGGGRGRPRLELSIWPLPAATRCCATVAGR